MAARWIDPGARVPCLRRARAPGYKTVIVGPGPAFYSADLNDFILRYEDRRTAASSRDTLMECLQTTYAAGAALAR
jgi:hypothetical protein